VVPLLSLAPFSAIGAPCRTNAGQVFYSETFKRRFPGHLQSGWCTKAEANGYPLLMRSSVMKMSGRKHMEVGMMMRMHAQ